MKKVLLIQLDGVSYSVLSRALDEGLMPFTQSLLNQKYNLHKLYCGLPSTTPASQARLFYGAENILPGFRFVVKEKGMIYVPLKSHEAEYIENSLLKTNNKPLLENGISILTLFHGGAKTNISAAGFAKNRNIIVTLLAYFLNVPRLIALLLRIMALILIERSERNVKRNIFSLRYIMKRILHEVLISEMAHYLTRKELEKQTPLIYVNFSGYDEIAHHYGPESQFTLYYLSILDLYIKKLFQVNSKLEDGYEISILSDHGQTPSIPIRIYSGDTLVSYLRNVYPDKNIIEHEDRNTNDSYSHSDMYLMNSGGLCLMYVPIKKESMFMRDIEMMFPGVGANLVGHKSVEGIAVRTEKGIEYRSGGQVFEVSEKSCGDQYEIFSVMTGPFAPDIAVFGKVIDDGRRTVAFEEQTGTHGSFGGDQTQSFFLSRDIFFEEKDIKNMASLYQVIKSYLSSP